MIFFKNLFIVLEGIDGVGKTTCAKLLASKISGCYYKTPPEIFEKIRYYIESFNEPTTRFIFYLSGAIYASKEISQILLNYPVVCDRWIYSTLAYHKSLGVDVSWINFEKMPILLPDFSFYLYAKEEICFQRLNSRDYQSKNDINLEKNRELQERIHREFLNFSLVLIDTSNLKPEEVCDKILAAIGQ